jgi:hypothetical protein
MQPMAYIKPAPLLLAALLTMNATHATVGGDQYLEFLGYEPTDQKVYLLRYYMDGRARAPQLYYFNLASNTPTKLVKVDSIYRLPNGKIDIDQDPVNSEFGRQLTAIKNRLVPLIPLATDSIRVNKLQTTQKSVIAWYDDYEGKPDTEKAHIPEYHYRYRLTTGLANTDTYRNTCYQSMPQMAISYRPQLLVKQAYAIPTQRYVIAGIKYLADQFEVGYYHEDPVVLSPKRQLSGTTLQDLIHCYWRY